MRAVKHHLRSKKIPASLELKGISTNNKPESFPYSGMRIMGAIQISTGVLVFALGLVDLIMTLSSYDADTRRYGDRYDKVASMTLACSPLWCGIWFSVTGAVGACLGRPKSKSLHFLKIAFLILNILCCAVFGPACIFINGYISYTRHTTFDCDLQWVVTLVIAFLGVVEIIMAVSSASVTCCCSPLNAGQVNVLVSPRHLKGGNLVLERESTELTTLSSGSEEEKRDDRGPKLKQSQTQTDQPHHSGHHDSSSVNNHDGRNNPHGNKSTQTVLPDIHADPQHQPNHADPQHQPNHERSPTPLSKPSPQTHTPQRTPRAELDVPIYNTFADSTGHPKQPKWAVPPW